MSSLPSSANQSARMAGPMLLAALLLPLAYGQAPLYYSNQNQYFLHGLADAGHGLLREDWLANTLDPTPVFSALVSLTARLLHPWAFHVYHAVLVGAYGAALMGLFFVLAGERAARRWPLFLLLLVGIHSAAARWASYRWLGLDYPWYFQAGVAAQYVLGAMFQPSAFGVLLVVAVGLFAAGRPALAVVGVGLAASVHATYLLPGALLTLGFLTALAVEGRTGKAVALGVLALALVAPVSVSSLLTFGPTTPETFARAQDIVVNFRIPHHSRPDLWLDAVAGLQLAWIAAGAALAGSRRLIVALAVPFVLMLALTGVQVATGSNFLALLFPWRVSAVLVPVATAVLLGRLALLPAAALDGRALRFVGAAGAIGLAAAGVWISAGRLAFQSGDEELAVMEFVRRSKQPGDVYFVPLKVPNLAATVRGAKSSDFQPVATKRADVRLIPLDLQRFRLHSGAPIFVDFKSIPYKDVEVIEWRDRLGVAEKVQADLRAGRLSAAVAELRRRGVTHLVWPTADEPPLTGLEDLYTDPYYGVYRIGDSPQEPLPVGPVDGGQAGT